MKKLPDDALNAWYLDEAQRAEIGFSPADTTTGTPQPYTPAQQLFDAAMLEARATVNESFAARMLDLAARCLPFLR